MRRDGNGRSSSATATGEANSLGAAFLVENWRWGALRVAASKILYEADGAT
jgi:hypothetical protein